MVTREIIINTFILHLGSRILSFLEFMLDVCV